MEHEAPGRGRTDGLHRGLEPVPSKPSVSLRIDADVLERFKARVNAVLRALKDASL